MTPEQILALAREAGIHHAHDSEGHWDGLTDEEVIDRLPRFTQQLEYADKRIVEILERFAALVEQHLRYDGIHTCHDQCTRPACVAVREAVLAEREACAQVCDRMRPTYRAYDHRYFDAATDCAATIRSRGEMK